jgi:hypothetical protein
MNMIRNQNQQQTHNTCSLYAINSLRIFTNLGTAQETEKNSIIKLGEQILEKTVIIGFENGTLLVFKKHRRSEYRPTQRNQFGHFFYEYAKQSLLRCEKYIDKTCLK